MLKKRETHSTHLVQLYRLNPLESVLRIFSSEVPNAVVHADVKTTLVKLMRLHRQRRGLMYSYQAEYVTPV